MIKKIQKFKYRHMLDLLMTTPYNKLLNVKVGMEDGWINEPTGVYDAVLVALDNEDLYKTLYYDNSPHLSDDYKLIVIKDMYKLYKNKNKGGK